MQPTRSTRATKRRPHNPDQDRCATRSCCVLITRVRYSSLRNIDEAGFDLRLWCYHCCRGATVDGIIWQLFEDRGWSTGLDAARQRLPCRACGARDCLIVPARARGPRPKDAIGVVVTLFFHFRSTGKGHSGRPSMREFALADARSRALMDWRTVKHWSPPAGHLHIVPPAPQPRRRPR